VLDSLADVPLAERAVPEQHTTAGRRAQILRGNWYANGELTGERFFLDCAKLCEQFGLPAEAFATTLRRLGTAQR